MLCNARPYCGSSFRTEQSPTAVGSGVKSTDILYLSKSISTAVKLYSVTNKSPEFKMNLSKSMKVLASKCTESTNSLKIADLQACRSAIFKLPRYKIWLSW